MSLPVGTRLGSYEILASIGAGEMAEVYRATDTRLRRDVALKVRREQFPESFDREVRAIASLNHRNICTIYDVGPNYLVMELVEGPTLAERIKKGAIPIEEAWGFAIQIAEALDAAHEKGVVHRDLNPSNIKVAPDGTVKVLDFGVAQISGKPSALSANGPPSSPAGTQAGLIVGTAAYMAPEQARGKNVDKRADIWAFAVVLYEMVTGRPPFRGEDLTDTLFSVVKEEPDLRAAPTELRRLLKKCLEKDPRKRLRDIGDVWELLEAEQETTTAPHARIRVAPVLPKLPSLLLWIAGIAVVLAMVTLAWMHFREPAVAAQQAILLPLAAPNEATFADRYGAYAPSPDGRSIVFTAYARGANTPTLWVRPLDSNKAKPLPGTEDGAFPTWSPDGKSIAFFAAGKLKRVDVAGGTPLVLGDATDDPVTPAGTWSRDGVILFGSSAGLLRVPASGGPVTLLTEVDAASKETGHGFPEFLPDGKRFLYFVASSDPRVEGIYASSLDNPKRRQQILRSSAKAVYVPAQLHDPGYLLSMQDRTLVAQRFQEDSLRLEGDPVPVAEEVTLHPDFPVRASFWASNTGMLTYSAASALFSRPVVWISRDGKQISEAAPPGVFGDIALAPGAGRMALVQKLSPTNQDIWVREFARGLMTHVTTDSSGDGQPVWSPDGLFLAFTASPENGEQAIYRKAAFGAGPQDRLFESPNLKRLLDWSKDGRFLLYTEDRDLMAVPLVGDRKPIPVVRTQFRVGTGAISPGGRWVAYTADDSGRFELYVQAFPSGPAPAPRGRWQVSHGGALEVKWRGDGNELYYESPDGRVLSATIQAEQQGVRTDTPHALFSADFDTDGHHEFDVTSDGQRFLMLLNPSGTNGWNRVTVVSNWQAALRR